ncbi:MAG: prolyl oligopeptidase family serine peptidase [Bifidobacteriaceae bacterium]|jgi:oligopeptidase B|nr:prolyl oligopeptidase family serine peptidase [Bifidobacteriaceae bacterium]
MNPINKKPIERKFHGDTFIDNYEWVRIWNENIFDSKKPKEFQEYLDFESAKYKSFSEPLKSLSDDLYKEYLARINESKISVPSRNKNYWYFSQTIEGLDYPISYRLKVTDIDDWNVPFYTSNNLKIDDIKNAEVLFDANIQKGESKFYGLGTSDITENEKYMLWTEDRIGDEKYKLFMRKIGEPNSEIAIKTKENISDAGFDLTDKYIIYTTHNDQYRSDKIWVHSLENPDLEDLLIYKEDDALYNCSYGITNERSHYQFFSYASESDVIYTISVPEFTDLIDEYFKSNGQKEISLDFLGESFFEKKLGFEYSISPVTINGKQYYTVKHNAENIDFDIDIYDENKQKISRIISSENSKFKLSLSFNANYFMLSYKEGIDTRIFYINRADFLIKTFDEQKDNWTEILPDIKTSKGAGLGAYESKMIRYSISSPIKPPELYDFDPVTSKENLLEKYEVLPAVDGTPYDEKNYVFNRFEITARDGELVPITIIRNAKTPLENAKVYMTGYGAYGISSESGFSTSRLSMLDRNVVYAVFHIRGGSEKGRKWYLDGKKFNKKNSFFDFIDCYKYLVDTYQINSEKSVITGGSAGGLLVGAVLNELVACAKSSADLPSFILDVPFVDALTTILNPELPLTIPEWEEWGNPISSKEVYEYMKEYSPYENIVPVKFATNIFIKTSLFDSRVMFVEPVKYAAALRDNGYDPVLQIESDQGGHRGATGRYDSYKELADETAAAIHYMLK